MEGSEGCYSIQKGGSAFLLNMPFQIGALSRETALSREFRRPKCNMKTHFCKLHSALCLEDPSARCKRCPSRDMEVPGRNTFWVVRFPGSKNIDGTGFQKHFFVWHTLPSSGEFWHLGIVKQAAQHIHYEVIQSGPAQGETSEAALPPHRCPHERRLLQAGAGLERVVKRTTPLHAVLPHLEPLCFPLHLLSQERWYKNLLNTLHTKGRDNAKSAILAWS